ncbi:hypothetical protein KXV22_004899 [Aspergillus fumigatus]|nr:hypothetical protein CNMCM8057_008007 [Aspergillus fumigatus]KAF4285620.1 hypothetical protein CNMCM8686_004930 [Aspergillus fumigatus]KAH1422611.1 hypothetical protein KXX32_007592 [Aspergillus fumigatus]KAH1575361.1 hypothetical protein KXX69_006101 [Aspergillus fumigatus]KAH1739103.1 hypothetical protein KXX09_004126 [Aspergillus fumigatus]
MATRAAKRRRVPTVRPLEDQCKSNESNPLISSSPDCEVLRHRNSPSDTDVNSQQTSASTAALPSEPVCWRTECSKPRSSKISKTRSLHNFFPAASEIQRWDTHKAESFRWTQPRPDMVDISDTIEDGYDSYDELFSDYIADRKVTPEKRMEAPLAAGERDNQAQAITHTFWNNHDKDAEELPWAQKYSPVSLNELAVHKKKVADVQSWLSDALCAFEKKLLVLRGPAGSGKTTTLSLLSDKLGFDVLEWRNPSGSEFAAKGFTSTTAQFEEFLTRGNRFRGLEFHGATGSSASKFNSSDHMTPRVILIEEFPTVFDGDSPGLAAFRLSLQRYLSVSSSPRSNIRNDIERHGSSPVVIIVSETMLNTEGSYSDNFTAHKLLGPDILSHPCTTIVDFNAIAPTFMFKALNLVLEKHIRRYRSAKRPGPAMLKSLSEVGDIRSAISSLEFLCLRYERPEKYPFHNATKTGQGGPVASLIVGYSFNGKKYSYGQILAVAVLTLGVVTAALADAQAKGEPLDIGHGGADLGITGTATGFAILASAMILSAFQGIYADRLYETYGRSHWKEALFYSHVLSIPLFLPTYPRLLDQWRAMLSSPPLQYRLLETSISVGKDAELPSGPSTNSNAVCGPRLDLGILGYCFLPSFIAHIPLQVAYLFLNALTQYLCIRGVHLLSAQTSSLTVTVVLNVRKLVSLLLSIYLFGNQLSPGVVIGAICVFAGGGLYGLEGARLRKPINKKD